MPKSVAIDPAVARRAGTLEVRPIQVNAYKQPLEAARAEHGHPTLVRILRDMLLVREFETMLDRIKRDGAYRGVRYTHRGPAHLSIGQEAAAVGQAVHLGADDHVFGSHRSHGEIIAKGLAAIERIDAGRLDAIMREHLDGEASDVITARLPAADPSTTAVRFLLYGLLAEIFGRRTGFTRGLGGSMHAFFPPFGSYPNNAIVGGSAPIAAGAALYKRVQRRPGLVIANIGDGASGSGVVWEAINFAAMRQFWTLWDEEHRGGLPVIFFFVNNFYAMGGQTIAETMAFDRLARMGAAFNESNLHAETIDGNDPLAVADAIRRKRSVIEAGEGPVVIDCQCYRQSGHSTSDVSSYRTAEEIAAWRAVDPIVEYGDRLEAAAVVDDAERRRLADWATERVEEACRLAVDLEVSPRLDPRSDREGYGRLMFSNVEHLLPEASDGRLRAMADRSARLRQIAGRSRRGLDDDGRPLPSTKAVTLRVALFEAIVEHALRDERLIIYGEENRDWEGAFGVYQGLTELLPYHRLFNAPISEATIIASAVGYAMEGGRALVELMYADFMGRAGDELFNQLAKWQPMSGGLLRLPVVVRVSVGSKYGAQHSQDWTALAAHVPGLKVAYPATPYDAKGLLAAALAGDDPVVFFESQLLYDVVERFNPDGVPRDYYRLPLGLPDVKRPGRDLTILTVGPALYRALDAATLLSSRFGVEAEVVDARSLVPFDYEPLLASVRKTGRLLLVSDAATRGSILNTLAADVGRQAFDDLDAPIAVVGAPNWIIPPAELEEAFFPQASQLLDVIAAELMPLPGHRPAVDWRGRAIEAARTGS
jgi:2-oxoisovalerate dehydrogenase E1 component